MYHSIYTKKSANDRFIPRRVPVDVDLLNNENSDPVNFQLKIDYDTEFINGSKILYNRDNYQKALRNVLLPLNTKVLNFFPPKKFSPSQVPIVTDELWPVKARKKPVIDKPETILDMPNLDSHICHHVVDCSSKNCLGTIFENEVHMWYTDSDFLKGATNTQNRVNNCIKWNSDGKSFALGLYPKRVGIWDVEKEKITSETFCCLSVFCEVFCLEWLYNKCLVTGCSQGCLTIHLSNFISVKTVRKAHDGAVVNMASSCNKTHLATSGMDKVVVVWTIPDLEVLFKLRFTSCVRALAWHPWKNSLLAVGDEHVILVNTNTSKIIGREKTAYPNSSIGCLTFNPISAELVVSYFVGRGRDGNAGVAVIAVLSNLDKMAEELHFHTGPVLYLLWGNGGTVLTSVSTDENLCIWDFFGNQKESKRYKKEKYSKKKLSQDSCLLRTYIR